MAKQKRTTVTLRNGARRRQAPLRSPTTAPSPPLTVRCLHCGAERQVRRRIAGDRFFCSPAHCTAWHRAERRRDLLGLVARLRANLADSEALDRLETELARL